MDERFKIFLEQLKGGATEKLEITCSPDFLEVKEPDLHFNDPVTVQGTAYLADEELILHIDCFVSAMIPCSICNAPVRVEMSIVNYYHVEPIAEVKLGYFNFKEVLREMILLEIPRFAECEGGCPQRKQLDKYLKKSKISDDQGYQPFADINLDQFKL